MNATFAPAIWNQEGLLTIPKRITVSPEGERLERCAEEVRRQLLQSLTIRTTPVSAIQALEEAGLRAAHENWDGYGAKAVDVDAYSKAADFIRALPTTAPIPEVSVDPDGEVSVEWNLGDRYILTISISGNGRLAYSALLGASRARGIEWLVNGVPRPIVDTLRRLVAAADRPITAS